MRGKRAKELRRLAARLWTPHQRVDVYRALKRFYTRNRRWPRGGGKLLL